VKVGLVGLGRMGSAIAQRLGERGCGVIAWDQNSKAMAAQGNRVRAVGSPRAVAESCRAFGLLRRQRQTNAETQS
jgi:3-hydroxyisobutyrate dehydrogenase-like beta-hydroxyacid dehydrogenase